GTDMLRSKYADASTPTFVEMDFQYRGKIYHIKRNPEYERPAKKGSGMAREKANAELIFPDGRTPITSSTEVTKAVIDLIGVDKKQFMQIAMLAQSDFLKLLLATTDERIKIFQEIFHTVNYKNLQDRLKDEANSLKANYDQLYNDIRQYIQRFSCAEMDEEKEALDKIKQMGEIISLSEIAEIMEKVLAKDEALKNDMEQKLQEIDKKMANLNQQLGKEEEEKKIQNSLEEQERILQKEEPLLAGYKTVYLESEQKSGQRDNLLATIEQEKGKLDEYTERQNLRQREKLADEDLQKMKKDLDDSKEMQEKTAEAIRKNKESLQDVAQAEVQQTSLQATERDLKNQQQQLEKLNKKIADCSNLGVEYRRISEKYKTAFGNYQKGREEQLAMEQAFYDEQAGLLAEHLEEDKPCPVCGSLVHPKPAEKAPHAPTKEELENKREKIAELEKDYQEYNAQASGKKAEYDEAVKRIQEQAQELLGTDDTKVISEQLKIKQAELQQNLNNLEQDLRRVSQAVQTKQKLEKEIPELEGKQEKLSQNIQKLAVDIAAKDSDLTAVREKIAELAARLKYADKAAAEEHIRGLEKQKKDIEDEMAEAKKNYEDCNAKLEAAKTAKGVLLKQLAEREKIDYQALKNEKTLLLEEQIKLNEERDSINLRYHANQESYDYILKQQDELLRKQEKLGWVKALANTANGTVAQKDKINLETYIQMNYFDRIINRANIRLMMMTGGQYELVRRQEALDGRSKTGLELNVIDHYNGSERSVRSLSGGESFKASLALALGLSDEIQTSAGGIQLDTLFVDEGFGSLDEESLNQAIQTLQQLTTGEKLVGIISHVAELKEKIDAQIIVTKDKTGGSRVKLVK
ncbi:MAG: SMC family ATPase, partial [Peptococcaceae bacterium]|nr:SMC family ATPase [Peptococcaceae bacterium]